MPTAEDIRQAWREGKAAGRAGKPTHLSGKEHVCPHTDSDLKAAWLDGYDKGRQGRHT